MTAAEFMAKLDEDPEYQRKAAERREKWRRLEEADALLEQPILDDFKTHELNGESIWHIVQNHAPLSEVAVEILLRWLKKFSELDLEDGENHTRVAESIVRALAATEISFAGNLLAECFDKTSEEGFKWAIANTIALTRPYSIDGWIADLRRIPYWDKTLRDLGFDR